MNEMCEVCRWDGFGKFISFSLYIESIAIAATNGSIEQVPFISHPKARLSNEFERTILELREQVSIRALANYFHLRWHTVKEIVKRYLQHKFATIDTSKVQAIGVDEIHIGHGQANSGFLTIVRDLESGAVIHVGDGKGVSALEGALCKLTASKLQLIAMDMANAYSTWFAEHFPHAQIVFDHFHVIKLMNDKLDHVRRSFRGFAGQKPRANGTGIF